MRTMPTESPRKAAFSPDTTTQPPRPHYAMLERKQRNFFPKVLGDQEIPQSGRSYWEAERSDGIDQVDSCRLWVPSSLWNAITQVKIVTKPSDAWEFIGVTGSCSLVQASALLRRRGVAEPTADVS